MEQYLNIVRDVLDNGIMKNNRTGISTMTIVGSMFKHDLRDGFPLLTTKKVSFDLVKKELEFFLKGKTNKNWLKERNCNIWNEWSNPETTKHIHDDNEKKLKAESSNDLGAIYGSQWRNFNYRYDFDGEGNKYQDGIDQLKKVVNKLLNNPNDRRMLVSSWNPLTMNTMALPPCHVLFHLTSIKNILHLTWFQRSCDLMLGIPFNITSYALLLHLFARHADMEAGTISGFFSDVHIYENHLDNAKEQIKRKPSKLPEIKTVGSKNIFDWCYKDTSVIGYNPNKKIKFDIVV